MTMHQIKAIKPDVIKAISDNCDRNVSEVAIYAIMHCLAGWSTGDGEVAQTIGQISAETRASETTVKRILAAAEQAHVLITVKHGGGPTRRATRRKFSLPNPNEEHHNSAPNTTNSDPTTSNKDPQRNHTERDTEIPTSTTPTSERQDHIENLIVELRAQKHDTHVRNPTAWRKQVKRNIHHEHGTRIQTLINRAPTAPDNLIASAIEDNNTQVLAPYCTPTTPDLPPPPTN